MLWSSLLTASCCCCCCCCCCCYCCCPLLSQNTYIHKLATFFGLSNLCFAFRFLPLVFLVCGPHGSKTLFKIAPARSSHWRCCQPICPLYMASEPRPQQIAKNWKTQHHGLKRSWKNSSQYQGTRGWQPVPGRGGGLDPLLPGMGKKFALSENPQVLFKDIRFFDHDSWRDCLNLKYSNIWRMKNWLRWDVTLSLHPMNDGHFFVTA